MNRRNFIIKPWLWAVAAFFPVKAIAENPYKEFEQLQTQLAGCLMAAEGSLQTLKVKRGDYAWTLALDRIHELHGIMETLQTRTENLRQIKEIACRPGIVDLYCLGVANGLVVALSIMETGDYDFEFVGTSEVGYEKCLVEIAKIKDWL